MTAKPETAAEVLAESIKTAIAHEKESGEFRRSDVLLLLSSAQDAVDALSAQGEAVAGTVVGHDSFGREVIDWNGEEALPAGTKLYTHPAPARVTEERSPALPMAKKWAEANGLAVTKEWMKGWNAYREMSLTVANAPRAIWREEWQGSGPQRGWHMRVLDGGNYGSVIAYLGDQISSDAVQALASSHNAALTAALEADHG